MSRELPILFNDAMTSAVLDGRKVETRRPVKPQPVCVVKGRPHKRLFVNDIRGGDIVRTDKSREGRQLVDPKPVPSPFGSPGDLLYVREAFCFLLSEPGEAPVEPRVPLYRASPDLWPAGLEAKWTPSIHMPKRLSRLWLRVERVWVERVQGIDEGGAMREGVEADLSRESRRSAFASLWSDLYAPKGLGWDSNPWVFACRFSIASTTGREGVWDV